MLLRLLAACWLIGTSDPALAAAGSVSAGGACSGDAPRVGPVTAGLPVPDAPAVTLERMAREAHQRGSDEEAVRLWVAAAGRHAEEGRPARRSESLLRAGQALVGLGFSSEAVALLEEARDVATPLGDARLEAAAAGALAAIRVEQGDFERAQQELARGLERAAAARDRALRAELLATDAELRAARGEPSADAFELSEASALEAGATRIAAQSAARAARAWLEEQRPMQAAAALERAARLADGLPDSDARAQLRIHVSRSWEDLAALVNGAERTARLERAAAGYRAALELAERIGADRTASWASGDLARLYELAGRREDAVALTRRAAAAAQRAVAPEAQFRWESQLAGLLLAGGDRAGALLAYRRAVATLDGLRGPGVAGLRFADSVEPVYRGLVDLLLREAAAAIRPEQRSALLDESRQRLEELKSAELRDYFQDACLASEVRSRAEQVPGAVVVYPVLFDDRLELIVGRGDALELVSVPVKAEEFEQSVRQLRALLPRRTSREYRPHAARLYDLLVRPIEAQLGLRERDTVVFVPGGSLRTIPLAALYDRESGRFLVEKYPVAVIPALQLTEPHSIDVEQARALLVGLTVASGDFPALEAVGSELDAVDALFEGTRLVDQEFTAESVTASLSSERFNIVHIATHAQFGDSPSNSFLLTYDGRLGMDDLSALIERTRYADQPLELLTLSACETAAGDERAALGLAGIAIRSGARSALATLWTVNDQAAAELVSLFYRQLASGGVSKAEALRRAQRALIAQRSYRHPGYWAPYVLISNWL